MDTSSGLDRANAFFGPNVSVDERLKKVRDMTERECCYGLTLREGIQPTVVAALKSRANRLARERMGKGRV